MTLKDKFIKEKLSTTLDIFSLIGKYHTVKFSNIDAYRQSKKLLAEVHEFEGAITDEEKIEEAVDIIISAIGYLTRMGRYSYLEVVNKFEKDLERDYPDGFQHREESDE